MVAAVLIAWLLDRAPMVREREAQRAGQAALKAGQEALRAELQKMKEQKPAWERPYTGGMFGLPLPADDSATLYRP